MIRRFSGDIFASCADWLMNPVNTQGVSGAGLARQFKMRCPIAVKFYEQQCMEGKIKPGQIIACGATSFCGSEAERSEPGVIFAFTKDHWRNPSRYGWIESVLEQTADFLYGQHPDPLDKKEMLSLAVPGLGCGLGGLQWAVVEPMIEHLLGQLEVDVRVFWPEQSGPRKHG